MINFLFPENAYGTTNNYYLSSSKAKASMTRGICKSYGMDLVSLDTINSGQAESQLFLQSCKQYDFYRSFGGYFVFFEQSTHVGAITTVGGSRDNWYWLKSGNRIDYPLSWGPGQPDNSGGHEFCLALLRDNSGNFSFNDMDCEAELHFICEKIV